MTNTTNTPPRTCAAAVLAPLLVFSVSILLNPSIEMCSTGGIDHGGGFCSASRSPFLDLLNLMGSPVSNSTWESISRITLLSSLAIAVIIFIAGFLIRSRRDENCRGETD